MLAVGVSLGGCPAREPAVAPAGPQTVVTAEGPPAPGPGNPDPGPPLEAPLPPPPDKPGVAYLELVHARLGEAWATFVDNCRTQLAADHPLNDPSLQVALDLAVDRHGALTALEVARPSGNAEYDQVAAEVVRDAAPFPPPPAGLISDDDVLHVRWRLARDRRQAGVATAEIERIEWPPERAIPKYIAAGDLDTAARRLLGAVAKAPDPAEALLGLGERLMAAAVRGALASKDPEAQRIAIEAAADGDVKSAARELRSLASGSQDLRLRREALLALGRIGDTQAADFLVQTLKRDHGQNADISGAAGRSLALLGESDRAAPLLTGWLDSAERESRWAALVVLAHVPVAATVPRLRALLAGAGERPMRLAACSALGAQTDSSARAEALRALRAGIGDRDPAVRAACATALAEAAARGLSSRGAYWEVVKLLKDRDERVRAAAALAAARLEPRRFASELYMLRSERSPVVLTELARGLGGVAGAEAQRMLARLAEHEDAAIRRLAVASLAGRPEQGAAALAAGRITDDDPAVRAAAVTAIDDVNALERLARDEDPAVRQAALGALVARRGRAASLGDILERFLAAPAGGLERLGLAHAWLGRDR